MDVSSTVSVISGVVSAVTAIGAAVLSVVVVAWGYKTVRGFIGR
nr:major capsid protein [Trinickia terrae]